MPQQFEILSMRERGIERHVPDFNEQLYDKLKATPWYLASLGLHGVIFLILSLFGSSSSGPPVQANLTADVKVPETELEDEIEPEVIETKPIDEQEKVLETPQLEESKVDE